MSVQASVEDGMLVVRIPIRIRPIEIVIDSARAAEIMNVAYSNREREVLQYILKGKVNKEIAAALGISVRVVKFHVTNVLRKAGCGSKHDLIQRCIVDLKEKKKS